MSSTHNRTRIQFHTPEKKVRPDGTINTHLKSTTPPTIEPGKYTTSSRPHPNHVSIQIERRAPRFGGQVSQEELHSILENYENKIDVLRHYIHSSDQIQREKIVGIFGFEYPCCSRNEEESKIVLKELSSKVKDLLRENNRLKNSRTVVTSRNDDELILAENKKLRLIIDELRRSENQSLQMLRSENYQLKRKIESLEVQLTRRSKVHHQPPPPPPTQVIVSPNYSLEEMQYSKKMLTKQMFEYSQELENKNKRNMEKINILQRNLEKIEQKVSDFERQRRIKIDSTIRKSFVMSQSMVRPIGDVGNQVVEDEIPKVKEAQFFSVVREPRVSHPQPIVQHVEHSTVIRNSQFQKEQSERISILDMKIKSLTEENLFLKTQINQMNGSVNKKVERIIHLEELLNRLEKQKSSYIKKTTVANPELENQVRIIKETLRSCGIQNFQVFFKEFNEILKQRNEMRSQLHEYTATATVSQKSIRKDHNNTLEKKISELTEENKGLLKKIGDLEAELDNYHTEIISSEIEKLNSINLSESMAPSGKDAIEWQYKVKACIENSLNRLEALERKIIDKKISTETTYERKDE